MRQLVDLPAPVLPGAPWRHAVQGFTGRSRLQLVFNSSAGYIDSVGVSMISSEGCRSELDVAGFDEKAPVMGQFPLPNAPTSETSESERSV